MCQVLRGGAGMTEEELRKLYLNRSEVHVDFGDWF